MEKKMGDPPTPWVMGWFFLKSGAQKQLKHTPQFSMIEEYHVSSATVPLPNIRTVAKSRNSSHF